MLISSDRDELRTMDELLPARLSATLDRLDLASRKLFPGVMQGERRSKQRGRSVEFEDFRNYVPGDDLRHIDWNVYARLDKLFIKVFQEEQDLALHLLVDVSASMAAGSPSKLVYAKQLAAALAYAALSHNNRVTLTLMGADKPAPADPVRGKRNIVRLGQTLIDARPGKAEPFESAVRTFIKGGLAGSARGSGGAGGGGGGRKGVVVVISDFLFPQGYEAGLKLLSAGALQGSADVCCVQVLSPGELDPMAEFGHDDRLRAAGIDVRLQDVESGRAAEVTLTLEVIERYKAGVRAYVEQLAGACRSRSMQHVMTPTDAAIERLIVGELRAMGLVR